ncbi:MAG: hypothetical protein LBF60_06500 [Treponema sp.]|jgi:hypothetical protein|nr:hypothetical protein [Treponema sp.]
MTGIELGKLFDFTLVFTQILNVLKYLPITMEIALVSFAGSLVIGFLVAIVEIRKVKIVSQIARFYVALTAANQAWAADIAYIRADEGFLYLSLLNHATPSGPEL